MEGLSRIAIRSAISQSLARSIMTCSSFQWRIKIAKWSTPPTSPLHTSSGCKGLEEFFPKTKDIIEEGERAGKSIMSLS